MQTLKTSAIVVLLVTVMYAAYVSITTPPQQVSPEMDDLILADGNDLNIDIGMPDSLDDLGISDGTADTFASGDTFGTDGSFANDQSFSSGISGTISDDSSSLNGGFDVAMDDRSAPPVASQAIAAIGLPKGNGRPADVKLDPNREYTSTGNEFSMPSASDAALITGESTDNANWANPPSSDSLPQQMLSGHTASVRANPMFGPTEETSPATSDDDVVDASRAKANLGLVNAIRMADKQYTEDQKKQALSTLSLFYETPDLPDDSRSELLSRLDPLAREVIYSREHLLDQPHRVRQNETLMQIASQYEVPWQLLANINGISDPITVLPGTDLKVVRGPFRADVNITRNELTLFMGDLYAGRFPIAVGSDPMPKPGTFTVLDKQRARTFYDADGTPIPPGSTNNPYGSMWLDLGGQLCIHGSPQSDQPTTNGCISLAERYAGDLYGILTQGSTVTIRR